MTKQEQAKEFNRRRNLTGVETKRMIGARTCDYRLSYCGKDYGSMTEVLKRGKVVDTLIILPNVDR